MRSKATPRTIDEYLAPQECISYNIPGFRLNGKYLVGFGAGANHCAFYPGAVIAGYEKELETYETSKGTIRFQPDHPLPAALVRKLVKERVARTTATRRR